MRKISMIFSEVANGRTESKFKMITLLATHYDKRRHVARTCLLPPELEDSGVSSFGNAKLNSKFRYDGLTQSVDWLLLGDVDCQFFLLKGPNFRPSDSPPAAKLSGLRSGPVDLNGLCVVMNVHCSAE